jgi:glycogen synthase
MLYKENKGIWRDIVKRNMQIDFSWNRTAEKYINLYKKASQNIDLDSEQMIL